MLRCTVASLIPLMRSKRYSKYADHFFHENAQLFDAIMKHKSYYILKELPVPIAESLFLPELPLLLKTQKRSGLWKVRDAKRISYDIVSAIRYVGRLDQYLHEGRFKYDVLASIHHEKDYYSLLLKKMVQGSQFREQKKMDSIAHEIIRGQHADGSWDDTTVGTVIAIEKLVQLGMSGQHESIDKGVNFLKNNYLIEVFGDDAGKPYGIVAHHMFSTQNRNQEFHVTLEVAPHLIPRNICFRHIAILQNALCVNLLLKLGYEQEPRVESALDNLFEMYGLYKGFCSSDIKSLSINKSGLSRPG